MFKRVQTVEPFSSHHRALDLELQLHMLKQDVSCFFLCSVMSSHRRALSVLLGSIDTVLEQPLLPWKLLEYEYMPMLSDVICVRGVLEG